MGRFFIRWLKWGAAFAAFLTLLILVLAGSMAFLDWSWQPAMRFLARLDWSFVRFAFFCGAVLSGLAAWMWHE